MEESPRAPKRAWATQSMAWVIAQPAAALLHVRLQDSDRASLLRVALETIGPQGLEKCVGGPALREDVGIELRAEIFW